MALACDRLERSSDPVCWIAQEVGYESQSAFSLAFKRVMACSPGQYAGKGERTQTPCWTAQARAL